MSRSAGTTRPASSASNASSVRTLGPPIGTGVSSSLRTSVAPKTPNRMKPH